jgi:sialic acid synthase SpsE
MNTRFIAEIGSNHNQSLTRTKKLITEAKKIGAWAVKFQFFKADQLYHPDFKPIINKMKNWELPKKFLSEIKQECEKKNLKFGCTVFNVNDISTLVKAEPDYLKIGSYELLNADLIKAVRDTGMPWMISTGLNGFQIAQHYLLFGKTPEAVFYCNSNYPAKPECCNLHLMQTDKWTMCECQSPTKFGWSDHTTEPGVIYQAVAYGAEYIEFHFDLDDMKGRESETGHCWAASKIKDVIQTVSVMEKSQKSLDTCQAQASKWRMDPEDNMRPLKRFRKGLLNS